ncbi:sialidase family protein [Acinetobacter sp. KS-LM10]|uniref:sialidase family protein n=1 Tax=Acinetobacter sp. KS-LM10 TaxID=3120518 RepID=UPI0030CEB6C0
MATNWNAILSNTNNLTDVLAILKKVLASLEVKADVTTINEALTHIQQLNIDISSAVESVDTALEKLQLEADEVIAQGFYKGFATEALLLAAKPVVSEMRARADDTRKIWRWTRTSAEGVTPITGTWTDTGLSELDQAKADATTKANAAEENAVTTSLINAKNESLNATSMIHETNTPNLHEFSDSDGGIFAAINSVGEFEAQDFKTESGNLSTVTKVISQQEIPGYTHVFADNEGNILFGIKEDGSVAGTSTSFGLSELRAGVLSSNDMNDVGLALDAKAIAETPLNYGLEVSPYGSDDTLHQRMPSAIKISDTRLFVAFAQFSTYGADGSNGRLVGRFVDFDLVNKTSEVSETQVIDGNRLGNNSRHPTFIQLKDKIVLIFNASASLIQMESFDNCQTWVNRKIINIAGFSPFALGLDTSVRIEGGRYAGRVCLAVYIQDIIGIMYSDDDCQTWSAGGLLNGNIAFPLTPKINEVSIALDASQNLIFAMRHEDYTVANRYVLFAKSTDGGQTIKPVGMNPRIRTSACQIGFKQVAPTVFDNVPKIIMSHPSLPSFDRKIFRVRISYDNCQTFVSEYAPFADNLNVAYSSICVLNNSTFALLYEEGQTNQIQSVKIKFLNLAEVM